MSSAVWYYSGLSERCRLCQHSWFLQVLRQVFLLQPTENDAPCISGLTGHLFPLGVTAFPSGLAICALCATMTAGMEDRTSVHMALASMLTVLSLDRYSCGFWQI